MTAIEKQQQVGNHLVGAIEESRVNEMSSGDLVRALSGPWVGERVQPATWFDGRPLQAGTAACILFQNNRIINATVCQQQQFR